MAGPKISPPPPNESGRQERFAIARFYWRLLGWRALWDALCHAIGLWSAVAMILLLVNKPIGQQFMNFDGISPWWALIPAAVFLVNMLLRAAHRLNVQVTAERDEARGQVAALQAKRNVTEEMEHYRRMWNDSLNELATLRASNVWPAHAAIGLWTVKHSHLLAMLKTDPARREMQELAKGFLASEPLGRMHAGMLWAREISHIRPEDVRLGVLDAKVEWAKWSPQAPPK